MATLTFDGTDDFVKFTPLTAALGTNTPNGAYTVAAVVRKTTAAVSAYTGGLMDSTETTQNYINLGINASNQLLLDDGFTASTATTLTWSSTTSWAVWAMTRTAGASVTPRLHLADLTGGGGFTHANGNNPAGDHAGPGTSGRLFLGGAAVASVPFPGQIGLYGCWNAALSDAQVDALITNKKTSDWWTSAAGQPLTLVECTSTSPTDLGANATFSVTTAPVLTGPDPTGWTFDGTGSAPNPVDVGTHRMPLAA